MLKRRRDEADDGGANETDDTTSYRTVFIDTDLDTHLAVLVSDSDTVSDLKIKAIFKHLECFPEMRELKISSVKVKRKGHYYHLPDTMIVRCVFEGTKNSWFLSVDASRFHCVGNDEDQSVREDTIGKTRKKRRKKKGKNSSTCHDVVANMVLGSTDKFEGSRGLEQKEGVEMKIFDKLADVDSTVHVTESKLKTSPVKDQASNKERPAPVSKDIFEMNLVRRPILESIVSGDSELGTDVANTTGEQELIPNCDFEMPMSEKLRDASTRVRVSSYQLGDLQGAAENSFGRKRSRAKKSTSHEELDMKNTVEASQNAYASEQDIVRNDGSSDANTKVGSIMPKTDVNHINEKEKEGKLSVAPGAETSLPSENNEATGATKEQLLSAKRTLDEKGNIESGHASSMKRKKKGHRRSAEKFPDKLDGEDDSWVNCRSLAAGTGSTTDPVTEQSKKGEISFDAEVKGPPHNKDLVQVQSAACRSSGYAKAEMTIKEVETISTAPTDVKAAEGHGNSGRSKKKKTEVEVSIYNNDVSCAPSVTHDPPANHFVQGSNQDKNTLPGGQKKGASKQVSKSAYAAGSHHQVEKGTCIGAEPLPVEEKEVEHLLLNHTDKNQETLSIAEKRLKTKTKKGESSKKSKSILSIEDQEVGHKDLAASINKLEDSHFIQGSNQDKNALLASRKKGASEQLSKSAYAAGSHHQVEKETSIEAELLPIEEKGNEVEHLLLNQTDKNQETPSIAEKRPKMKTKKSQSSKRCKSILSIQDQEVGHKDLAASKAKLEDVNPLPQPMEMDESGKNSHVDHLAGTNLENQRNSGTHSNFGSSREDVRNADSVTSTKEALGEMHVPDVNTYKSEGINFKKYFVPGQQGEVASKKPTKSNRHTKAGRKSKDGMTSRETLEDISNSRIEVAIPSRSSAQGDKTPEETGKLAIFDAPAYKNKSEESMDESTSSSSSKGSDKFPEDNRRQTGSEIHSLDTRNTKMGTGNIEDFMQPKKGLLPKPWPKFGDSRSRKSDSKEGGNSDSMTETQSDSSSSGNSVEGSEISQSSTPKGANVAKSNDGAKHKLKSNNFLGLDITMDMILRSSSRFKKAKVTAAQSQDEESQPVDVVPDSLLDTQNQ
ncbi:putative protein isoform X1 [Capsicum annuum]|uniref:uncharacterized protein LOC107859126 isoform X1 n=2 Tax=Capsicum annuum TaxID=4072 RepID=UPI001FB05731|nr:uncharacterized protein LOC107859126 isoform X1 [Capsicum annuum]